MPQRLAAVMSLLAFAICLVVGGFSADNPFGTTVARALAAMAATFVVGLILGVMAQKMIQENVDGSQKILSESQAKTAARDR